MKKLAVLFIAVIGLSSCSLFQKPSMTQEQIDALINEKARIEEQLINMTQKYELEKIKVAECAEAMAAEAAPAKAEGKYSVVVGSFKEDANANEYAEKVKQLGGSGAIIYGPSNFKFVVYSSHASLGDAAVQMELARTNVASLAWIWMEK